MIPAADIKYQELAIRSECTSVNNPTIGRRGNLGTRTSSNRKPFFGPTIAVGGAKFLQFDPVNRNWNLSAQCREGSRRGQPARIAECRKHRTAIAGRVA